MCVITKTPSITHSRFETDSMSLREPSTSLLEATLLGWSIMRDMSGSNLSMVRPSKLHHLYDSLTLKPIYATGLDILTICFNDVTDRSTSALINTFRGWPLALILRFFQYTPSGRIIEAYYRFSGHYVGDIASLQSDAEDSITYITAC